MLWYVCGFVCSGFTPATSTAHHVGTRNYSNSGQTFVNILQLDVKGLILSLFSMCFIQRGPDGARKVLTEATGLLDLHRDC